MAKAILILEEMPKCCGDCILGDDDSSGLYCVPKEEYFDGEDTMEERATFCPLREVPQKKKRNFDTLAELHEIIGYNACIDEILGECEDG